jgi:hypothetical protein
MHSLWPSNPKAKYRFHGVAMVFNNLQQIYLKKLSNFSKIYYHTPYQVPLLRGANVAPNSQIRPSTMLFLPTVGKSKLQHLRGFQCRNIHIKLCEYWSTDFRS